MIQQYTSTKKQRGHRSSLITRGMGKNQALLLLGMSLPEIVKETIQIARIVGQSGTKRLLNELEDIIVSARLVSVNDSSPHQKIHGFVNVKMSKDSQHKVGFVKHVSTRAKNAWELFKVSIERLR